MFESSKCITNVKVLCRLWNSDHILEKKVKVLVSQSHLTLYDPMDCSPPGFSVHGILQVRILESIAISFSRGVSRLRDQIQVSCIAGGFFTIWATGEALYSSIY